MMALDDQQRMLRYRENNLAPSNVLYPEEDWYSQYGMPAPIEGTPPELDRRRMLEEMNAPPSRMVQRSAPPPLDPESDIAGGGGVSNTPITAPPRMSSLDDVDRRMREYESIKTQGPPKPSWWRYPLAVATGAYAGPQVGRAVLYPGYDRQVGAAKAGVENALAMAKAQQEGERATAYAGAQGALARQRGAQAGAARVIQRDPTKAVADVSGGQYTELSAAQPEVAKPPTTIEAAVTGIRLNPQSDPETKKKQIAELVGDYNSLHKTNLAPHYETDEQGNVTAVLLEDSRAGGSYSTTSLGKIGRPQREPQGPQGSFTPITDETGVVTDFVNPTTGQVRPNPVAGGRRSGVPAGARERAANIEGMVEDLTALEALARKPENQSSIGRFSGNAAALERWLGTASAEVNDLFRLSDNLADQLLRARSGAQINEREYTRLRSLVPDPRGPLNTFTSNLGLFRNELRRLQSNMGAAERPTKPAPAGSEGAQQGGTVEKWVRDVQGRLVRAQ